MDVCGLDNSWSCNIIVIIIVVIVLLSLIIMFVVELVPFIDDVVAIV